MATAPKLVTFRAVRSQASGWTDVRVRAFKPGPNGSDLELGDEVIVNAFGGTESGRPEAERFAAALNRAVEEFHAPPRDPARAPTET